jgi:hypothetical protein
MGTYMGYDMGRSAGFLAIGGMGWSAIWTGLEGRLHQGLTTQSKLWLVVSSFVRAWMAPDCPRSSQVAINRWGDLPSYILSGYSGVQKLLGGSPGVCGGYTFGGMPGSTAGWQPGPGREEAARVGGFLA